MREPVKSGSYPQRAGPVLSDGKSQDTPARPSASATAVSRLRARSPDGLPEPWRWPKFAGLRTYPRGPAHQPGLYDPDPSRGYSMIPSLLTRTIEKLPPEVRLEGRILFLVDDPELVRR